MKKSETIVVTDSDFYQRITKKYQKSRRSPLRFPLLIFLDKMRNFLSQGMNIDVLLRFYLTRQYQKFSIFLNNLQTIQKLFHDISIFSHLSSSPMERIYRSASLKSLYAGDIAVFLNELLHPIFSVPINKQVSSQILYYGKNVEFFNPVAGEITNNIRSVFAKYLTQNRNISSYDLQIIQKLFHDIPVFSQAQYNPLEKIYRSAFSKSVYSSDNDVFLNKLLCSLLSVPINDQVSSQILYYGNNLSRILQSRMIKPGIIFSIGKTDELSSSGRSHVNYLQILSPAFIILKSKSSSDSPEKGFVYDFSFHSIYEQKSPTIIIKWHNGLPENAFNQTGIFDIHYPDIKLSDRNIKNLQIPQTIIIKNNNDQKIDYSFIQKEKIRNYISSFIQTSPEIISELKGDKLFTESNIRYSFTNVQFKYGKISQIFGKYLSPILKDKLHHQFRCVSEHKLILINIPASHYNQSIYDLSAQDIQISGNIMKIAYGGPSITKSQNYLKNIFLHDPKSSGIHSYQFLENSIQLSGSNEFFNNIYQNSISFARPLNKKDMNKGSEVPFLPLPQKELITRTDNFYFQNVPDLENAIEKVEKMASEIKETVSRSLISREPEIKRQIELDNLSDKVYQMIDRRLKIEKERRGYL